MSSRSPIVSGAIGLALLVVVMDHRPASAQCVINGPDSLCAGATAPMCGPDGNFFFLWTAPDGSTSDYQCVDEAGPGTWTLEMYDYINRISYGPCSHTIFSPTAAACAIEGPSSACQGATVTLCGPEDALSWTWSGPGGFFSTQRCVEVSTAGAYSLQVPGPAGCPGPGTSCSHTLALTACNINVSCPRPPAFWAYSCRGEVNGNRARVSADQLARLAACVDDRVALFDWRRDVRGFCRTMRPIQSNLRTRAARQFAGVWANVCASDVVITPSSGPNVSLASQAMVQLEGTSMTVASWLSAAEASLASLEGASLRHASVKHAYRKIIREGWRINHGEGVESVCGYLGHHKDVVRLAGGALDADFEDDESLESELADDGDAPMTMSVTGANPFSTATTISFALGSSEAVDVELGVFDLSGRRVRELARGRYQPGTHEVRWDGTGDDGVRVRGGMYFVVGRVGGERVDARVTLIR